MKFVVLVSLALLAFAQDTYAAAVPLEENAAESNPPEGQDDYSSNNENPLSVDGAGSEVGDYTDAGTGEVPPSAGDDTYSDGNTSSSHVNMATYVGTGGQPNVDQKSVAESFSSSLVMRNGKVVDEKSGGQRVEDNNGKITVTKLGGKPQ